MNCNQKEDVEMDMRLFRNVNSPFSFNGAGAACNKIYLVHMRMQMRLINYFYKRGALRASFFCLS